VWWYIPVILALQSSWKLRQEDWLETSLMYKVRVCPESRERERERRREGARDTEPPLRADLTGVRDGELPVAGGMQAELTRMFYKESQPGQKSAVIPEPSI
jgi:hypothetical protein